MPDLDIIACSNGKEALTATKRFEFEIITTGMSLPDIDGYDLIREIRKTPKNRDTAIFVVSGDTDNRIMGADDEENTAVTAYFDKAEGHKSLVNFILNFLGKDSDIPIKILYVDKSATSTAITSSIFSKNGIGFVHYKDAQVALEDLRNDLTPDFKTSFDVMITDIMLSSELTGFELIQTVRNDIGLDYLALPILLMTMEPVDDERTDFTGIFGAGTNDFITKPVSEEDLLSRIETLVSIKRQSEALNTL
ncbi:MAG: CheY-like chemotaxis protein [Gammaproteobacteria bacterium]|jgi:CheY-like chemotaxis protein